MLWESPVPWESWKPLRLGPYAVVSAPDGRVVAYDGKGEAKVRAGTARCSASDWSLRLGYVDSRPNPRESMHLHGHERSRGLAHDQRRGRRVLRRGRAGSRRDGRQGSGLVSSPAATHRDDPRGARSRSTGRAGDGPIPKSTSPPAPNRAARPVGPAPEPHLNGVDLVIKYYGFAGASPGCINGVTRKRGSQGSLTGVAILGVDCEIANLE